MIIQIMKHEDITPDQAVPLKLALQDAGFPNITLWKDYVQVHATQGDMIEISHIIDNLK